MKGETTMRMNFNTFRTLTDGQFDNKTLATVCLKLEQMGFELNFKYRPNTTIELGDYDNDGNWFEYQIDFTDGICGWSEWVETPYGY